MARFEVWASFEDGLEVKVESHVSIKNAKAAIDAMDNQNRRDKSVGYGFPHGMPVYFIVKKGE